MIKIHQIPSIKITTTYSNISTNITYNYCFVLTDTTQNDLNSWLVINTTGHYLISGMVLFFESLEDAILFKLKWIL